MSDWRPGSDKDLDEMDLVGLIEAYRDRFGVAAMPHLIFPRSQMRRLEQAMREALKEGRPIPEDELPPGLPPFKDALL